MQYYFKRFFVLHSSEVIFSFLIKKSRHKSIEIEIYRNISEVINENSTSAFNATHQERPKIKARSKRNKMTKNFEQAHYSRVLT